MQRPFWYGTLRETKESTLWVCDGKCLPSLCPLIQRSLLEAAVCIREMASTAWDA